MGTLSEAIHSYLKKYPPALELFLQLEETGDIYLIGGVLREFRDNGNILDLRDIDIIIDIKNRKQWKKILDEFETKMNSFGGYKLFCSGLVVDVWPLEETWAYRKSIVKCRPNEYPDHLVETVFLNIDAIIYDLKRNTWFDEKYQEAKRSGILDVVLEHNPQVPLNIIRAMILKKRYSMSYSQKLKNIITREMGKDKKFSDKLMQIQEDRYKREILSKDEIEKELASTALRK